MFKLSDWTHLKLSFSSLSIFFLIALFILRILPTPLRSLVEGVEAAYWMAKRNPLDYDSKSIRIEKNPNGLRVVIQL
jgi:hypothetical protein